jgi:hypothetical protein
LQTFFSNFEGRLETHVEQVRLYHQPHSRQGDNFDERIACCSADISNERDAVKALTSIEPEASAEISKFIDRDFTWRIRLEFFLHPEVSHIAFFEDECFCRLMKRDELSFVLESPSWSSTKAREMI